MFAIAIWDAPRRRLVLARDRFGIKPLYYRSPGGELEFASELRALPRGEIDLDALEAFLSFNVVPGPLTIFRDVPQAPARPPARVGGRACPRSSSYADRSGGRRTRVRSERGGAGGGAARAPARLRPRASRLRRAGRRAPLGRRRLVADHRAAAEASPQAPPHVHRRVRGALVRRARPTRVSWRERYGTDHHSIVVRPDAGHGRCRCWRRSSTSRSPTRRRSRPTSSPSSPPRTVKVVLSGEGGDELFGGYYTYQADLLAARSGRLARALRPAVERLPVSTGRSASTTRRSASCGPRIFLRSSATTGGRRSSRPTRATR